MAADSLAGGVDSSPFPLLVVDHQGIVTRANRPALDLLPGLRRRKPLHGRVPEWLSAAHAGCLASAHGPVGDRVAKAQASVWSDAETAWWLTDETEAHAARTALGVERDRTAFLIETSNQLLASLNVDTCMETTALLAARHLADTAVVVGPAAKRRLTLTRAWRDGTVSPELVAADPADVPGLAEALQGFPPVPSRWIDPASAPGWLTPGSQPDLVGSMMVIPLPGNGVPAGALILLRGPAREQFTEDEEIFARLFAARAGAAIGAALLYKEQSGIARLLMSELALPRLERVEGVEFAGGYRAAHDEQRIGGDFYDIHPPHARDPRTLVVLGDVCGKGLEAAVLTGRIRTSIQALRTVESNHERILQLLNRALLSEHHTRFATLVLASVHRRDDGVEVELTCGGHPPPLIVRADGQVEEAATRGTLIGAVEPVRAQSCTVLLAPGETCLLYSDGIIEARGGPRGGEMFGQQRLAAALAECSGMLAEAVVERVQMLAGQWVAGGAHDDMAVVAITAPLRPGPEAGADGSRRGARQTPAAQAVTPVSSAQTHRLGKERVSE